MVWDKDFLDLLRKRFRQEELNGGYGWNASRDIATGIRDHMMNQVHGGHVLVIGSASPWIEAILLELGAANVTTLEYTAVDNRVENIRYQL